MARLNPPQRSHEHKHQLQLAAQHPTHAIAAAAEPLPFYLFGCLSGKRSAVGSAVVY